MSTFLRVVLPIAIIILLVGGVTYVTQLAPAPPTTAMTPTKAGGKLPEPLVVPEPIAIWGADQRQRPPRERYAQEFEENTSTYFDFWAGNVTPAATQLTLRSVSCGKCVPSFSVAVIDADALAATCDKNPALKKAFEKFGEQSFDAAALGLVPLEEKLEWKSLKPPDGQFTVPPADPRTNIRLAVLRMNIAAKNPGRQLLSAEFMANGGDKKLAVKRLEAAIVTVPPVMIFPKDARIGELRFGEERAVDFYLWSATRDKFPMQLPPAGDDPCIVFGKPAQLSKEELGRLDAEIQQGSLPETRPKCGYRVRMTVYERRGNDQLDLGAINRKIKFNFGTDFEAVAELTGTVRGDVQLLGDKGEDDRIRLGAFHSEVQYLSKPFQLSVAQPGMKLEFLSASPSALKVQLTPPSGPAPIWSLRVEAPANSIFGPLPSGSHIMLQIVGPQPRKVRIPIDGAGITR